MRNSKADQEGRGHVRYLGAHTMQRLGAWLSAAGITTGGLLFRQVLKDGATVTGRLGARSIRSIIARRAAAALGRAPHHGAECQHLSTFAAMSSPRSAPRSSPSAMSRRSGWERFAAGRVTMQQPVGHRRHRQSVQVGQGAQ